MILFDYLFQKSINSIKSILVSPSTSAPPISISHPHSTPYHPFVRSSFVSFISSFGFTKTSYFWNKFDPFHMVGGTVDVGYDIVPHRLDYLLKIQNERWGSLKQYFINPALCWSDLTILITCFLFFIVLRICCSGIYDKRWRKYGSLYQTLFRRYIQKDKKHKFSENLWYTTWHFTSLSLGLYVLFCEGRAPPDGYGWTVPVLKNWDTTWFLIPTPGEFQAGNSGWPLFPVSSEVRLLYLVELSFWSACLAFIGMETRREDFWVMFIHHIITIVLIALSYTCSYWRFGLAVLATHDVGDIFLYFSKTLHYSTCHPVLVDLGFILFVVAFFVTRLLFFPLFCVRPSFATGFWMSWTGGIVKSHWDVPGGLALPSSLCLLQILHIFWTGLILRMIVRTIKAKTVTDMGDIRSESDDEEYISDDILFDDELKGDMDSSTDSSEKSKELLKKIE